MSLSFQLPGSVPMGNELTGKSRQGKPDVQENPRVMLWSRCSASLPRDLSHPGKGEGERGQRHTHIEYLQARSTLWCRGSKFF